MPCKCGAVGLYRVGALEYCKAHHGDATKQIAKMGNPKAPQRKTGVKTAKSRVTLVHKPRPKTKQDKLDCQAALKANPTLAEQKLKLLLSKNEHTKSLYKFQEIISGFIPDFTNRKHRILLEADGSVHYTTAGQRRDNRRDYILSRNGWKVLRFSNKEILDNPRKVLQSIHLEQCARLDRMPDQQS